MVILYLVLLHALPILRKFTLPRLSLFGRHTRGLTRTVVKSRLHRDPNTNVLCATCSKCVLSVAGRDSGAVKLELTDAAGELHVDIFV